MALTLDGDNGISGINGSAATPAVQGTDTNTGLTFGTDTVGVVTGGSTRTTVDSGGRLGIGTTSPGSYNADGNQLVVGSGSGNQGLTINAGASSVGSIFFAKGTLASDPIKAWIKADGSSEYLAFGTAAAERMRITSGGDLYFNATVSTKTTDGFRIENGGIPNVARGSSGTFMQFFNSGNGSQIGGITNSGGTSTVYNTSSDYRLKENVVPVADGITRLQQLNPSRFNFIANPSKTVDGFIAHEVQTVVPEAITGAKDEVEVWKEGEELPDGVSIGDNKLDEDGNTIPVYQGIDQSKLVPLLTAALQEAIGKIEALETRVAQLEGGAA